MAVATDRTAWNPVGLSRPVSPDGPGRAFCFVEQTGQPLQTWFPRKWRRRLPATLEDAGESDGAQCEVPVSVTLSKDLVQEACRLTSDPSGTVETLLATYVARE